MRRRLRIPRQARRARGRTGWLWSVPRWTVRLRLTVLYGGLFLACGTGLLAIAYLLAVTRFPGSHSTEPTLDGNTSALDPGPAIAGAQPSSAHTDQAQRQVEQVHLVLVQCGIALAVMAVVAVGLGWLVAGRILRPLQAMTTATRRISEENLHRRLALPGPRDELKDLADTIDDLLERLESAFEAQRQFVANASHELRTPLTLERTMLEVALADPDATAASLRAACQDVLASGQQQERLIEALLTLARSQQGLRQRQPVDLATLAAGVLHEHGPDPRGAGLRLCTSLEPAVVAGDPRLLERLLTNVIDNATRYNTSPGWLEVTTGSRGGRPGLTVVNSGPPVPAEQLRRLLQPFQRLDADRTGGGAGLGLGLSIVDAIVKAHGGTLDLSCGPAGGLELRVRFAACPAPHPPSRVATSTNTIRS